jgi:hypothetical protein
MNRIAIVAGVLCLALTCARPAAAQEQEKREAWTIAFIEGLDALTRRDLAASERLFQQCIRIYPDRAVPYYNLACAYSLGGKVQPAVEALRACFERGYRDLAHMERDMDLDPIRKTPAYRRALSDFAEALTLRSASPVAHEPSGSGSYPVLVFLPDQDADPDALLSDLRSALTGWGIVVPRGAAINADNSSEWRVNQAVDAWLDAHPRADRDRVTLAGNGASGHVALTCAAHRPDVYASVVAAGSRLGSAVGDVELDGTRAYLIVHKDDPEEVEAGVAARDAFAEAGSPVVLERYPVAAPLARDRALLLRAVSWLQGEAISLPGAGKVRPF